jgi:tetratricopeptide (TPR) repeat protein
VAHFADLKQARLEVDRALRDHRTIILLDNMESILPDRGSMTTSGANAGTKEPDESAVKETQASADGSEFKLQLAALFDLCGALLDAAPATRLVFTSREMLPEPFAHRHRLAQLRELDPADAIELVSQVMRQEGLEPKLDDAGNTAQEITDLVEAVGCHARALALLAREIAIRGVGATTGSVQRLMAGLDRKHPRDRENSLYASVELSLRRLPPEMRQQIKALAVFHGGANLAVLDRVLEVDEPVAANIARALIEVGLAEAMPYGHLRLDPALPAYLQRGLSEAEQEGARSRWAEAMRGLTGVLRQQRSQNVELSARLTLWELPNLMALLDWAEEHSTPEEVIDLATSMEGLLANLGRPRALARATRAREEATRRLGDDGDWSHARFEAERARIERLLERGELPEALQSAQRLLERSLSAGDTAYPGAAYDTAMAHSLLGRVLRLGGAAEAALGPLGEARRRFQALADSGSKEAAVLAAGSISRTADCLRDLGRFDDAAAAYEGAARRHEQLDDLRWVAVDKGNLGTVRMLQERYDEALEAYSEARDTFQSLGEPRSVAALWHQVGMVYRNAKRFEQAEPLTANRSRSRSGRRILRARPGASVSWATFTARWDGWRRR